MNHYIFTALQQRLFLIVGGAVGEADDIGVKAVIIVLGLLPLLGGLLMALIREQLYAVQISTALGEVKVFDAFDKSYIDRIITAINTARLGG